jgi:hypothetical protein
MSGPAGGRARSDAVMQVTKREGRSFLSLVILSVSAAETQGRAAPRTRFVASGDGKLSWGCIVIREAVELPGHAAGGRLTRGEERRPCPRGESETPLEATWPRRCVSADVFGAGKRSVCRAPASRFRVTWPSTSITP